MPQAEIIGPVYDDVRYSADSFIVSRHRVRTMRSPLLSVPETIRTPATGRVVYTVTSACDRPVGGAS